MALWDTRVRILQIFIDFFLTFAANSRGQEEYEVCFTSSK